MLVDDLQKVGETKFFWNLDLPRFISGTQYFRFESDVFKIENSTCHDFCAQMFWIREIPSNYCVDRVQTLNFF